MPDTTPNSHQPDLPIEDRFLAWVDWLVEPAAAMPEPDADFADLAATARIAQRAAGPGSVHLAPDRAETLWEEIMGTTPAATPVQTTLPRSVELPPAGGRSRTVVSPPVGWRGMLPTVVLVAAIIAVAAVTIWRLAGPFDIDFGGDSSGTADQPGVAAPATPATVSTDGCPLTSDMLVFVGETPEGVAELGMIWAQVEPDSDFVIACPGVEHPTPLLTGVTNATSLTWPGTVMLELVGGDAIVFNIGTGGQVNLGPDAAQGRHWVDESSPWLLTPANAAYTDWRITNLKTMASMTLSDEIGGVLAEPMYPEIRWNPTSDHATLKAGPGLGMSGLPGNPENSTVVEMPGGALVVEETLETQRWIDTWGQEAVTEGAIAYQTQIDGQPLIRIEDARSGDEMAEITEVDFNGPPGQRFEFAGAGNMLAYISEGQLWLFDYGAVGARPEQVVIEDRQAIAVYPTGVPGRVLVEMDSDENIGGPGIGGAKMVSILDVSSGEVAAVPGLLPILGLPSSETLDYLVTFTPDADSESRSTAHMTDISSGSVVLSSEPMDASIQTLIESNNVLAASAMGAVVTVTPPGEDAVLLDANSGMIATISTERLPASEGKGELRWNIAPSFDMKHLYAIGLPKPEGASGLDIANPSDPVRLGDFSIAPLSADPQWSGSLGTIPAGFVPGIPTGQPGDEPTRLEAQEFPSPVSTPATSVAENDGCDLTGDIPIFTGAVPDLPFIETWLLLSDDGTLTLACADAESVVAEGVTGIRATGWPGTIVATMDSGELRSINLLAGETRDIGFESVLTEDVSNVAPLLTYPGSPWLGVPANREMTDWRFVDLRTMDSFLLSDELGGELPTSTVVRLYAYTPDAAVIAFPGEPVMSATPIPGAAVRTLPFEHALLVIDGSLDNRRWVETTRTLLTSATISPDGALLALSEPTDSGATIRVEQLTDGELVADTGIDYGGGGSMLLLDGEAGLLHLADDRLDLVTWDGTGTVTVETLIAFESRQNVPLLVQTADPDVVLVGVEGHSGESIGYLVNVASGMITEVPGLLQLPFVSAQYADRVPPHYVLAAVPVVEGGQRSVLRLIDVSTGEIATESGLIGTESGELAASQAALRDDGAIGFVFREDGRIVVLDAESGDAYVVETPAVEGSVAEGDWFIDVGTDGALMWAAIWSQGQESPIFVRATARDAEWVEVIPAAPIPLVPGASSLP